MANFPAASGVVTRFFLESFLFGVYCVLFFAVLYLKVVRLADRHRTTSLSVLLGLIAQFLILSIHWIGTIYETYFTIVQLGGGPEAQHFLTDIRRPTSVLQITTFVLSSILTDTLVIQRLFIIFSRGYEPIIIPALLLVGQIVASGGLINVFVHPDFETLNILALHVLSDGWVTSTLVLSIAISAYSTGLIAWKIWRIRSVLAGTEVTTYGSDRTNVMFFLAVLVESAALQTATAITLLAMFQAGNTGESIIMPITPAICGISTISIHARIGLGWAHEPRTTPTLSQVNAARINFSTTTQTVDDGIYPSGRGREGEEHAYGEAK